MPTKSIRSIETKSISRCGKVFPVSGDTETVGCYFTSEQLVDLARTALIASQWQGEVRMTIFRTNQRVSFTKQVADRRRISVRIGFAEGVEVTERL